MTFLLFCTLFLTWPLHELRLIEAQRLPRSVEFSVSKKSSMPNAEPLRTVRTSQSTPETQKIFQEIYRGKAWSEEGRGSGAGSTRASTVVTMSIIRSVVAKYNVTTFIDAPCGGMEWQPILLQQLEEDNPNLQYTGLDIVTTVIEDNKARFKDHSNWNFDVHDISAKPLPLNADLIMSRDALQHLSCELVVNSLQNFARSRPKYLLVGSYDDVHGTNHNIGSGGYFSINLREPPYNLDDGVLQVFSEHSTQVLPEYPEKYMLLLSGKYLATLDFAAMRQECKKT